MSNVAAFDESKCKLYVNSLKNLVKTNMTEGATSISKFGKIMQ